MALALMLLAMVQAAEHTYSGEGMHQKVFINGSSVGASDIQILSRGGRGGGMGGLAIVSKGLLVKGLGRGASLKKHNVSVWGGAGGIEVNVLSLVCCINNSG